MSTRAAASKTVIKSLGRRSGNISAHVLSRIVREARIRFDAEKTADTALEAKDTATGSGRIRFHVPDAGSRHKAA